MSDIKITQIEMAKKTGIDKASISRYLSGEKIPILNTAQHIVETCNVPISIFMDKEVQVDFFGKAYLKNDVKYKKKEVKK